MNKNDIAPCGLDCVNCELNVKNGMKEVWEMVAKAYGKTAEEMSCKGCREQGGCTVHDNCETLACVQEKGLDYCSDCDEFPCNRLLPAKDMAERLPHNYKLYNLCRIKLNGPEKFLQESMEIRKRYFQGKMVIGAGPQLPKEA